MNRGLPYLNENKTLRRERKREVMKQYRKRERFFFEWFYLPLKSSESKAGPTRKVSVGFPFFVVC